MTEALLRAVEVELTELRAERAKLGSDGHGAAADAHAAVTSRINELEHTHETAVVVHPGADGYDTVAVGTTVTVEEGDRSRTYRIVLERGDAPVVGTVSATSPVGRALVGRAVGDAATVTRPDGRARRLTVRGVVADAALDA